MSSHTPDMNVAGQITGSSRKAIIGPIVVSIAFVMELTLVPILLPMIQSEFGLSLGQLAWVFNSYGVAVALGVLLGGWLGDAYNAKRIFSIGVVLFGFGSILVALSGSFQGLVLARAIQGFGGGIFSPLIPILLTRVSPDRPGRVLIVWGSVAGYVAALAPLVYSTFLLDFDWHLAFVFFAVLATAALLIIPWAERPGDSKPIPRPRARLARFIMARPLWFMFGYVFCTYGSITYFLFKMPVWLDETGWAVSSIGLILSLMWLSFSLVSTFLRNRVDQPNVRIIMMLAPVLIASGFPIAYFCSDLVCLILSAVLVGSGLACSNAPSTQLILKFAPRGMSAVSASLDITFARLGGVTLVGIFAQSAFGYAAIAIVLMCLIATVCALIATRNLRIG